jgi:hypothetical protein
MKRALMSLAGLYMIPLGVPVGPPKFARLLTAGSPVFGACVG